MKDSLRFAKKAVSIAVTATTIVWSIGIASFAPLATQAATPGSLIKMAGSSSVYYLGSDNKRYVFVNQPTYNSWYPDFSTVQTVSASELQSYPIGGNITIRPGTLLVKITTDPKVYAVEPGGVLRWVSSEAIAKDLYGDSWATKVVDVPDAFFVNYKPGADITSDMYPSGTLIKSSSSSNIYYVDGSSKRNVTASGLTANLLQASNAVTALDTVFNALSAGTDITSQDSSAWSIVGGVSTATGTGLTVALASDTPASTVQAAPTAYNPTLKINLTASADGAVNVTGINLTRTGVSTDSEIGQVGIYDSTGHRHGNVVTFGNSVAMLVFSSDPIIVPAGQTVSVVAKTNLAGVFAGGINVTSGTYALSVVKSSDVVTTATVNGTFPISGNGFSLIGATGIAQLTIQAQTQAGGQLNAPTQVNQGTTNVMVTKFAIAEGSGQEDAKITSLTLTQNGSAADGDYSNIRLVDQKGTTLATTQSASGGKILLDLSANPLVIPKGQTRYITVEVDTSNNTNSALRTLDFTIQNDYDVEAYGVNSGAGILPTAVLAQSFPIGDGLDALNVADNLGGAEPSNLMQFEAGTLSISKSSNSPSGKMAPGATNQVLGSFDVQAFGEPVEIQRITFVVTADGVNEIGLGNQVLTGTLRIQNGTGGIIYSSSANTPTLYSANPAFTIVNSTVAAPAVPGPAVATQVTLNSYYTVTPGTTGQIVFVGDIPQGATTNDTYEILVTGVYVRKVSSNNYLGVASIVTSNQRQVDTTSLTISQNSSYNPVKLVRGASGADIGSFNIQAGPAEAVNVTTMNAIVGAHNVAAPPLGYLGTVADNSLLTGVSNIRLCTAGSGSQGACPTGEMQYGSTVSSPTPTTGNTFSGTVTVPASSTITVDVYADVSNSFDPSADANPLNNFIGAKVAVTAGVGQSSQTNIQAAAVEGQIVQMVNNGQLLVQADSSDTPIQQIVHADQIDVPVLALKVSENTNAEDLTLNKLYFAATNGGGNYTNMKLFNGTTQIGSTTRITNGEIQFTGLNMLVAKGASPTVLWLKGTANSSGVQQPGTLTYFAPTYFEYVGASSGNGNTTRASGGVTALVANSTTLTVNSSSQFVVNQKVAIDLNDNGVVTLGGAEDNAGAGYTILAIPTATTVTLNAAANVTKAGGRVIIYDIAVIPAKTNLVFQSNALINHNAEPYPTLNTSASTGANGSAGQPIADFTIANQGSRDISVYGLRFKFSGSFVSGSAGNNDSCVGGGIFAVQVWQNNQNQGGILVNNAGVAGNGTSCFGTGQTASFSFTAPVTVSAGGSTDFVIKGNTSLTRFGLNTSGTISYGVYLDGTQGNGLNLGAGNAGNGTEGSVRWDYQDANGIYGSTGTINAPATEIDYVAADAVANYGSSMDVTDNYPVNGPVINY